MELFTQRVGEGERGAGWCVQNKEKGVLVQRNKEEAGFVIDFDILSAQRRREVGLVVIITLTFAVFSECI